jgi:hypothetical protein
MAIANDHLGHPCPKTQYGVDLVLGQRRPLQKSKTLQTRPRPEDKDFPRTNFMRAEAHGIPIHDIRDAQGQSLSYKRCGFTVLTMESHLVTKDCDDEQTLLDLYFDGLQRKLRHFFITPHVVLMGH